MILYKGSSVDIRTKANSNANITAYHSYLIVKKVGQQNDEYFYSVTPWLASSGAGFRWQLFCTCYATSGV